MTAIELLIQETLELDAQASYATTHSEHEFAIMRLAERAGALARVLSKAIAQRNSYHSDNCGSSDCDAEQLDNAELMALTERAK
jgi:hypothetical protein